MLCFSWRLDNSGWDRVEIRKGKARGNCFIIMQRLGFKSRFAVFSGKVILLIGFSGGVEQDQFMQLLVWTVNRWSGCLHSVPHYIVITPFRNLSRRAINKHHDEKDLKLETTKE